MNERFLSHATVYRQERGTARVSLSGEVDELLGEPETVVWFLDEDTGLVYVVPDGEVSIR